MVENIGTMKEEIEEINEDVSLFTDNSLKLKSSSKPQLETKEEFDEMLEQEMKKAGIKLSEDDGEVRFLMSEDLVTHLNQHALKGGLFREWSAVAILFPKSYAFFSELTEQGRQLRELSETWRLDERYPALGGIARFVVIEGMTRLEPKGYRSNEILPEIMNELKSSRRYYKFYATCRKLWDNAHESERKGDLNNLYAEGSRKPEPNEIIAASVLCAASDVSKNFNEAFLELESMSILDIFDKSGSYMIRNEKLIPATELDDMEKLIKELGFGIGTEKQIGNIREVLRKIKEKSLQLGEHYENGSLKTIGGQALQLYKSIESQPYKLRIGEISNSKNYTTLLQNLLNDCENFIKECR